MKFTKCLVLGCLYLGYSFCHPVLGQSITLIDSFGEKSIIEVQSREKFQEVIQVIQTYFQTDLSLVADQLFTGMCDNPLMAEMTNQNLNVAFTPTGVTIRSKIVDRNYQRHFTEDEKKTITWIVNTLAWDGITTIYGKEKELKSEGKRLTSMHPLRFCEVFLTDESLKCGAAKIRTRISFVKNGFYNGIIDTLKEESKKNNLKPQDIQDFAQTVKVNYHDILTLLQKEQWTKFVDYVIENVPREGDPSRYNIY